MPDPMPPEAPFARITHNYAALANADEIILVLRGERKRAVLKAALAGDAHLPVEQLLAAAAGPVTIFWSSR